MLFNSVCNEFSPEGGEPGVIGRVRLGSNGIAIAVPAAIINIATASIAVSFFIFLTPSFFIFPI